MGIFSSTRADKKYTWVSKDELYPGFVQPALIDLWLFELTRFSVDCGSLKAKL